MLKPLVWIILALHALAQPQGLPAKTPVLAEPANSAESAPGQSPSASSGQALAERQAKWQRLRILDINEDGYAWRNGRWLGRAEQVQIYRKHDADEALNLLRRSRGKNVAGGFWLIATTGALALVGNQVGLQQDTQRAAAVGSNTNSNTYQSWGTGAGVLVGLAIGGIIHHCYSNAADDLRAQAAESYNHKVLEDLQLGAAPVPGGAELGVSGRF